MKTIIIGDGYVGSAFRDAGYPCIGKNDFRYDGENFDELGLMIHFSHNVDTIINCIGYTNTTASEDPKNFDAVWNANAQFVRELSRFCHRTGKKLIHISTGDLYGNVFDMTTNVESNPNMDVGTHYRFTKLAGERFCHEDDLILRIRLPFDGRNHPKNLLTKLPRFTKFYSYSNDYTYLPDLVNGAIILAEKKQKGIFNVVSHEDGCTLFLLKNILQLPQFDKYDIHNEDDPNFIRELSNLHIHNISNDTKFRGWYPQTPLEEAVKTSWNQLHSPDDVLS